MKWLKKILSILIVLELVYLVLLNGALRLPLTQQIINDIRPEKFHAAWEKAWTWHPFRVHARGVFANGQARSQQWQFTAKEVSGSISLLPLILKRVRVRNVVGVDIDYRQRPRLMPGRDYTGMLEFFPEIEGWEMTEADLSPFPDRRPWHVSIKNIEVSGNHSVWFYQLKGQLQGAVEADLKVRSLGGPFSMDINMLDLQLGTVYANESHEVLQYGNFKGSLGFSEFVPRDNKNIGVLNYLSFDIESDIDMDSLGFINLFLMNFDGVKVGGRGAVDGRLNFEQGKVMPGTDLTIDASNLKVKVLAMDIAGDGTINLQVDDQTEESLDIAFGFDNLDITHEEDQAPMLVGEDMTLTLGTDCRIVPDEEQQTNVRSISASIGGLTVPELPLFQRFLPEKWPIALHGGTGKLQGQVSLAPTAMSIDISIDSDDADIGIKQYRFDTDLDLALKLDNPDVLTDSTHVAGTFLKLSNARLVKEGSIDADPAELEIVINDGMLSLFGEQQKQANHNMTDLLGLLTNTNAKDLLGNSRGLMGFEATVSSLGWMGVLLGGDHHTRVSGQGAVRGDLQLVAGLPAPGTDVEVVASPLAVEFLDYSAHGDGRIGLVVEKGGENPDWLLTIDLLDAGLMRRQETSAIIRDVTMKLSTLIKDVSLEETENDFVLKLKILSANVSDMSVFNRYFPPESPFTFVAGTADLKADIELQRDDATGWVRLESENLQARIDQHDLGANLLANIKLAGGEPAEMIFDIGGSSLLLDQVRIAGEKQQFQGDYWSARLDLQRGNTTWKAPIKLDLETALFMSDSRPLVALFRNEGGGKWLSSMLTVEDINGTAEFSLADERLVIPHAHTTSDKIEIGAKGTISEAANDGVIYLRYKKIGAILKVKDGDRNVDIINARKKYDEYRIRP